MGVPLVCPGCSGSVQVADVHEGKEVQCAECRTIGVVRVDQAGAARLVVAEAAVAAANPEASCAACGERLAPGERFCPKCGAGVSAAGEVLRQRRVKAVASRTRRAAGAGRKKAMTASRWILVLSILFTIGGTVLGIMAQRNAAQALQNLEGMADDEPYPEEIAGKVYTAGELREKIRAEPLLIFVTNYGLAIVMFGLFLWSRRAPLPAIVTALCVYLVIQALGAVVDPDTALKGILIKILVICALLSGIKGALAARAEARSEEERAEGAASA